MDIYYLVAKTPSRQNAFASKRLRVKTPSRQNAFASKRLRVKTPSRQNASTQLNSIFSFIYFGRTQFRGLGNIVGFENSPNSPRKYSPVMKFIDRMSGGKSGGVLTQRRFDAKAF
jgi:hypothetical protein